MDRHACASLAERLLLSAIWSAVLRAVIAARANKVVVIPIPKTRKNIATSPGPKIPRMIEKMRMMAAPGHGTIPVATSVAIDDGKSLCKD